MSRSTRPAPPGPPRPAIDPAIPAAARQLLAAAPDGALTPASSPAPARAHGRLGEAIDVMAPGLLVTAVFAAAGAGMPVILPSFFNFLFGPPPRGQAAGLAGLVAASQVVFFLIAVAAAGFSVLLTMTLLSPARAGGADTPTRKAARAYHSRYITPDDLDGPAAALLARAQHAIATITATALCRDGLLDDPPDSPELAQHEWDIAQALADLTRLRRQQCPPPGRAEQRARRDTEATITTRVRALEAYAAETASAETAYRAWQAAAQPELSDAALDLLAAAPAHQQATTSLAARTQRAAAARLALTELTSTPGTASTPSPPGGRPLRAAALAGVRAARHLRTALGGGTSSPGQPAGCCDTSACTCHAAAPRQTAYPGHRPARAAATTPRTISKENQS